MREVLDVDEPAELSAVAGHGDGLATEGLAEEDGDDEVVAHPRPEGDPVAEDREGNAVEALVAVAQHFPRELAGGVQVIDLAGPERRVLRAAWIRSGSIDPNGACEQDARDAVQPRGLEDVRRGLDVQ